MSHRWNQYRSSGKTYVQFLGCQTRGTSDRWNYLISWIIGQVEYQTSCMDLSTLRSSLVKSGDIRWFQVVSRFSKYDHLVLSLFCFFTISFENDLDLKWSWVLQLLWFLYNPVLRLKLLMYILKLPVTGFYN